MTSHSYSREEVYSKIHKALRNGLFELSMLAGSTDFGNPTEVQAVQSMYLDIQAMLHEHAEKEEKYVFPRLEARRPGSTQADILEHHEIHEKLAALHSGLESLLENLPSSDSEIGYQWYLDLNEFIADYLAHMHVEETKSARHIQELFSFGELMQIQSEITGSMTPAETARSLGIMIPAMYHSERVKFFSAIKANAPAPVLGLVLGIAEQRLSGTAFAALSSALSEPSLA